jgi:hypothetical protein
VGGTPATFVSSHWQYQPPTVTSVTPDTLPPSPGPGLTMLLQGYNFGGVPGAVTLGGQPLACPSWSNTRVVCAPTPGVLATVSLIVTAVTRLVSPPAVVRYQAPVVASVVVRSPGLGLQAVSEAVSGTRGGLVLTVVGTHFGSSIDSSSLTASVWLTRGGAVPGPPWDAASQGKSEV